MRARAGIYAFTFDTQGPGQIVRVEALRAGVLNFNVPLGTALSLLVGT